MILTSSSNLVASCSNLATYSISNLKYFHCDCSLVLCLLIKYSILGQLYLDHTWLSGQALQKRRKHPARRILILSSALLNSSLAFEQGLTWSS